MADLENPFEGKPATTALVYIGSAGGSLSYGLSKLTTFDLVTEVAGSSPEAAGAAFAVAGGIALASDVGLIELED